MSLQITPDYYPYQFKQKSLYDYLTKIDKYLVVNENTSANKKKLGSKLQTRITQLIDKVKTFGPSLWNEDLYEGGLVHRNDQFWTSQETDYLFLEQFILDDYADPLFLINKLPKHKHLMITNFRASRDPYTLFSREIYEFFKPHSQTEESSQNSTTQKLAQLLKNYYQSYSKLFPNNLYRSINYMKFWNSFMELLKGTASNGQSENNQSAETKFFTIPSNGEKLFAPFSTNGIDKTIATLFETLIYSKEEVSQLQQWTSSESSETAKSASKIPLINYLKSNTTAQDTTSENTCSTQSTVSGIQQVHHPALEHQTIKGSSPTSEGTQKDLMVYLAQSAILFQKISKMNNFSSDFSQDSRKEFIEKAWDNAQLIATNYKNRIKKIREYFQAAQIVDSQFNPEKKCFSRSNSKTLAVISYPPSQLGAGNSAIQTISKYPFLYTEIGFKEALPKNGPSHTISLNSHSHEGISEDIFGLDDNGWWWRLGDSSFSKNGFSSFKESVDSVIFLATTDDWNILNSSDNPKMSALQKLIKSDNGEKHSKLSHSSYHLWNEGLRSPLALNLLLDSLVDNLTRQFNVQLSQSVTALSDNSAGNNLSQKYKDAMDWGNYWESQFIEGKSSSDTVSSSVS
ncbi:ABC transporter [Candidatus Mycoplasma haematominutum]|uniref:ABC transporter n=1 Tax=Candidatus Mycoplasma haematominutum TaxID=209446 RepID=UPI001FE18D81|nr:ABC transporter [Candidatus Mycoplasma haematominutum]